ncbi:MAG: tetratricopeptide repeat protein [Chloroflexi bacterium]|nr:tetratricopeptide repeat protein [Chloroflexota bacterium]
MNEFFGGALSVPHVGRRAQLDQIVQKVRTGTGPQLIFVSAEGGFGKTRMLMAVLERLRGESDRYLCAQELVDLYHLEHHTSLGLVSALYLALTPSLDPFSRFRSEYDTLARIRLSGDAINVKEQQQKVVEGFEERFEEIIRSCAAERPVVIALDTAERVCYEILHGISEEPSYFQYADAWEWLLKRLPDWGNVSVLVAGRPVIRQMLIREASKRAGILITEYELEVFDFEDTTEYLEAVQKTAAQSSIESVKDVANLLCDMSEGFRKKLFAASRGRPILLALCIDLATTSPQRFFSIEELTDLQDLEAAIIRRIMEMDGDLRVVVQALGRLSKGATPELLAVGMGCLPQEAESFLDAVRPLSFVKQRPADQKIFLHDEMYAMLRRHVFDYPGDVVAEQEFYKPVIEYYRKQINDSKNRIDNAFAEVDEAKNAFAEVDEAKAVTVDSTRLEQLYSERRNLMVDEVYYRLENLPARGFKQYYRYMREASYSVNLLLDTQLFVVLQEWWIEKDPDYQADKLDGLPRSFVDSEILVRPVVRAAIGGRHQAASEAASTLRKQLAQVDPSNHSWATTKTVIDFWEAYAKTLYGSADDQNDAKQLLMEGIAALKSLLEQPEFADIDVNAENSSSVSVWSDEAALNKWRAMAVLAFGHRVLGYHHRTVSQYQQAIAEYRAAIVLWRLVKMQVELAYTQNDLGYVYSLLNQIDDAVDMANTALKLRRFLGFRSHMALSLNTLGLIYLADGRYRDAEENCTKALAIFRALESRRGVGLALLALAEALRRGAAAQKERPLSDRADALRKADQYNKESIQIFDDLGESLRQVEARIEAGCCLRDWLEMRNNFPDPGDDLRKLAVKSREYLQSASTLAREKDMLFHELDAGANLAKLQFVELNRRSEKIDYLPVEKAIAETMARVPGEYLWREESGPPTVALDRANKRLWTRVAKLFMLRGHMQFEQYLAGGSGFRDRLSQPEVQTQIEKIVENYFWTLEYNYFYVSDFRGFRQTTTQIHERLEQLSVAELQRISQSVVALEERWGVDRKEDPEGRRGSELRKLLVRRTLWSLL